MNNTMNYKEKIQRKHRIQKDIISSVCSHKVMRMVGMEKYASTYDSDLFDRQNEIFSRVDLGSIVYAVIPFSETELAKIEVSHQYRPYIIICKDEDTVSAFSCSTSNCRTPYKVHVSKRDIYDKSTFIYTGTVYTLKPEHITSYIGTLSPALLRKVKRMVPFSSSYLDCFDNVPCGCVKGDVISYDGKEFYVYAENDSFLSLHPVIRECRTEYSVPFPDKVPDLSGKFIDTDTAVRIPSSASYTFTAYSNDPFIKYVQNIKQMKARAK